jgi:protein SCO1/2
MKVTEYMTVGKRYRGCNRLLLALLLSLTPVAEAMPSQVTASENDGTITIEIPANVGGSFSLLDHNGKTVTENDFAGRWLLVSFGYTACPNVCPTTLAEIADALDILRTARNQLAVLFVTVDPDKDRPAVLAEYVAAFHPDIVGLTGSKEAISKITASYHIEANRQLLSDGDYAIDHTALTYLMKPDGTVATVFLHGMTSGHMAGEIGKFID